MAARGSTGGRPPRPRPQPSRRLRCPAPRGTRRQPERRMRGYSAGRWAWGRRPAWVAGQGPGQRL